ncbi:hypothetical protein N7492_006380 [Penicillium capsulatum]|uniref:Rhodanese domain-containing protein n=1 Tax=Penicillium capsulatum TaxID=69766 RepID=A0A9W9I3Z0_9EURO|nr:hypothetical protein N7492_006380 [Penicillium capsulatum]KAJ6109028.1 hypothetical protein N7512_008865 [Penicillium capsulatum]
MESDISHEAQPLKIIVVGGAAGGVSAALRARRLNEKSSIILIEKGHLANYANSGVPSFLSGVIENDTFLIHQSAAGLRSRYNLDLRNDTELISISRECHSIRVRRVDISEEYDLSYDKLILAQGAYPIPLRVPGVDRAHIFPFRTTLDLDQIKNYIFKHHSQSAVIIGGEYLALKAVESLYDFGLSINLVYDKDRLCEDFDTEFASLIQDELREHKVRLHPNTRVRNIAPGIVDDGYVVTLANDLAIPTDLVVIAIGVTPRTTIAKASGINCKNGVLVNEFMQTSDPDIYAVGDITDRSLLLSTPNKLPLSVPASQQGRIAADHIMKRAVPYPGCFTTYCCKIRNLTAGISGVSVERLKEAGYYPKFVTVYVPDHTGYYPSSHQMMLRLAFQSDTGRIIGAQIIGRSGVESRVDVLSTAIQARMTVFDLETIKLSYAPQYGSAKHPINVVGMVASNLLRGDVRLTTARQLESHLGTSQIIDVRPPEDFSKQHVRLAVNIPIDTLRDSLGYIDKEREIIVYSRVGYHGYLAYRILVQLGYTVSNLDGGMKLMIEGGWGPALLSSESN